MKRNFDSFEDLEVYQSLCKLHLEISELTIKFPKYEMYEIGSQVRKSSNSAPVNIASAWNKKRVNIYIEGINQASGDIRETIHHLYMAYKKNYIEKPLYLNLVNQYNECEHMLKLLVKSVNSWKSRHNHFTKNQYPNSNYL